MMDKKHTMPNGKMMTEKEMEKMMLEKKREKAMNKSTKMLKKLKK